MLIRDALTPILFRRGRLRDASLLERRANEQFLEAVIAIGLVCVLTSLAAASYAGFAQRTTLTESASLTRGFAIDILSYHALTGRFPDDATGVLNTDRFGSRYFSAATWQDQEVVLSLGTSLAWPLVSPQGPAAGPTAQRGGGASLAWRPARAAASGPVVMLCGLAEAPAGFAAAAPRHTSVPAARLPSFCRH